MEHMLISIDNALQICEDLQTVRIEKIPVSRSLHRTLATDIFSIENMPPFNKSAVDGYACKYSDIDKDLECIATIHAGSNYNLEIKLGTCVKIMTGAKVPLGSDCVFMYEDAELLSDSKVRCTNTKTKSNICSEGEDVQKGACILSKNTVIESHHTAILSAFGITEIEVYYQPKVAILATGSELVEPNVQIQEGLIRNCNSSFLLSMIPWAEYRGIVHDDYLITKQIVTDLFKIYDILIVTGGASDSEYDLLPNVIQELVFTTKVRKISMQPGKPCLIARLDDKICIGLSGNPVSSFVQSILYVTKVLRLPSKPLLQLPLLQDFERKKSERVLFVPAKITDEGVQIIASNGSAHIASLAKANSFIEIPKDCKVLNKGELVRVRQI